MHYVIYLTTRQDQKKPSKKLVQPTLVSSKTTDTIEAQDTTDGSDVNPVATAAAIAAAAASAATGPFLQVEQKLIDLHVVCNGICCYKVLRASHNSQMSNSAA